MIEGIVKVNKKWVLRILLQGEMYSINCNNKKDATNKYRKYMKRFNLKRKFPGNIGVLKKTKKTPSSKKIKCDRKKFSQTDKWSILYIQEYRCNICKIILPKEGPEFDHIIPLQYKGPDRLTNLQALCIKCHDTKTQKVDNKILDIIIPTYISQCHYDKINEGKGEDLTININGITLGEIQKKIYEIEKNELEKTIYPSTNKENPQDIGNNIDINNEKKIVYITHNHYYCNHNNHNNHINRINHKKTCDDDIYCINYK